MRIEFSNLVKTKLRHLKNWLIEHYDLKTAKRILSEMLSDIETLSTHPEIGANIAGIYPLETDYWYLFTHQHYMVYRFDEEKVTIVQMFHEREDFMMKLFGISGRTKESIDYWGE